MRDGKCRNTRPVSVGRAAALAVTGVSCFGWVSVLSACLAMSLSAQVRIPIPGSVVPMTLQSLVLLLVGFSLTPGRAAAAMGLYGALGIAGLAVFAPGSAGVWGPTGGYIVGFVPAAWLIARVSGAGRAEHVRGSKFLWGKLLVAGAVGLGVLYLLGVGWLAVWSGGGLRDALRQGLMPFAGKAVVQWVLAVMVCSRVRSWRRERRSDMESLEELG